MPSYKLLNQDVAKIAKLSRLVLTPEELDEFALQLSQTASYIDILQELDTTSVLPTAQVNDKTNVFRDDVITPSLTQEQALSQATDTYQGFFKTEATIKK